MKHSILALLCVVGLWACDAQDAPAIDTKAPSPVAAAAHEPTVAPEKAPAPQAPKPARAEVPLYEQSTLFYGVYLNAHKTGWMKVEMIPSDSQVVLRTHLEAKVGGMGKVSRVVLDETRTYDRKTEALTKLSFEQGTETGSVRVEAKRDEKGALQLVVNAGSALTSHTVTTQETLSDAIAVRKLAREGALGKKVVVQQFDPSAMKTMKVEHTLVAAEKKMFGGVEVPFLQIETSYVDMGVLENSWADATGRLFEAKVGGFFTARLESEKEAKRQDYTQDLLVSAVVKPPAPIPNQDKIEKLEITMQGFGKVLPPASERQGVAEQSDNVILTLSKDGPLPTTSLPEKAVGEYTKSTPFIQAENPQIQNMARKVIGDATTMDVAVSRLVKFVYNHVKDSYVPSFSNSLEVLQSQRGDCTEHSVLFVGLARALNIPARVAVGIGYWPAGEGFGWHAWAEVQADGKWYTVDPTWNQVNADATHIKLADGDPMQQARIVMLLGKLSILKVN